MSTSLLSFLQIGEGLIQVTRSSFQGKLGLLVRDVDGCYYFWPPDSSWGAWSAHTLREVTEKLEELNKEENGGL